MKCRYLEKHFSETTGKLHIACPYRKSTGVDVHVVIKDGYCYRWEQCMVVQCKFSQLQADIESLLSLTW